MKTHSPAREELAKKVRPLHKNKHTFEKNPSSEDNVALKKILKNYPKKYQNKKKKTIF